MRSFTLRLSRHQLGATYRRRLTSLVNAKDAGKRVWKQRLPTVYNLLGSVSKMTETTTITSVTTTEVSSTVDNTTTTTTWTQTWSQWWSRSWTLRWKPTSVDELLQAEREMLQGADVEYEQSLVKIGETTYINTLKCGSGPPLVLLHGFAAGVGFWVCNLKELSKHHTVYAIDTIGFGRSSRAPFRGKTSEESEEYFLESLESWRKAVNLDKFTLLGHSFGGYLSTLYSLKHPEKVDHLILADPWGVPRRPDSIDTNRLPLRYRLIGKILVNFNPLATVRAAGPYGPGLIQRFRSDISEKFEHLYQDPSVVNSYIYHLNAQNPTGETAFALMTVYFGWAKKPLVDRIHDLDKNIRVTMLYGDSTWMDPSAGKAVKEMLENESEFHYISRAGHHVYVDNHVMFNKLVNEASLRHRQKQSQ